MFSLALPVSLSFPLFFSFLCYLRFLFLCEVYHVFTMVFFVSLSPLLSSRFFILPFFFPFSCVRFITPDHAGFFSLFSLLFFTFFLCYQLPLIYREIYRDRFFCLSFFLPFFSFLYFSFLLCYLPLLSCLNFIMTDHDGLLVFLFSFSYFFLLCC